MPGYVIHLATLTPKERKNRDFVRGVLAPDLLKKWYKLYNRDLSQVEAKYLEWSKDGNLPPFSALSKRICQKESSNGSTGMHYGLSSSPSLNAFFSDPAVDIGTAFWNGYFKHLIGDSSLYQALSIEEKLQATWKRFESLPDAQNLYAAEITKLHNDWDILNDIYIKKYNISLPDEVLELNIVDFKTGELVYVDKSAVDSIIETLNLINLN